MQHTPRGTLAEADLPLRHFEELGDEALGGSAVSRSPVRVCQPTKRQWNATETFDQTVRLQDGLIVAPELRCRRDQEPAGIEVSWLERQNLLEYPDRRFVFASERMHVSDSDPRTKVQRVESLCSPDKLERIVKTGQLGTQRWPDIANHILFEGNKGRYHLTVIPPRV